MRQVPAKARTHTHLAKQALTDIVAAGTDAQAVEAISLIPSKKSSVILREELADGKNGTSRYSHVISHAWRLVPGGRDLFIALVERSARNGDSDARAWWRVFSDLLPVHQNRVNLDDVSEASGVTPDRIMAVVISTQVRLGMDVGEFVAAVAHPKIVHQTAKSAMRIGGAYADIALKDREHMLTHGKFIPSRGAQGTNVTVNNTAQARADAHALSASQPSVPTFSDSLRPAIMAQREVQQVITGETVDED